ncbi:CLAVATA3/ESR [Hirschfeldia incana]|nr:CLAVATA3/ESR [Hirschfeldia incana]
MKLWSTRLSLLIIVVFIFARLHFSSGGRKLPSTTAMEEFQERFRRLRFHSERMLPPVSTGKKYKQIYGDSLKKTPGGPNPLHNK